MTLRSFLYKKSVGALSCSNGLNFLCKLISKYTLFCSVALLLKSVLLERISILFSKPSRFNMPCGLLTFILPLYRVFGNCTVMSQNTLARLFNAQISARYALELITSNRELISDIFVI